MIEFKGYLSGNAEKFYIKESKKLSFWALMIAALISSALMLPLIYFVFQSWTAVGFFGIIFFLFPFCPLLATKKMIKASEPRLITIIEHEMTYRTDMGEEDSRMINEVALLIDYGDFYLAKMSVRTKHNCFIFQKALLSQGTLEEFEALFAGKIVRKLQTK